MLTEEYANEKTNRHIGRLLGELKKAGTPAPKMLSDFIISYFHFLKEDLTPYLEWENKNGVDKTISNTNKSP